MRYGLYGSRYGVRPYASISSRSKGPGVVACWLMAIVIGIVGAAIWGLF